MAPPRAERTIPLDNASMNFASVGRETSPPPGWLPLEPADALGSVSAGAIALAHLGDRTLAFVADADDDAIVTFDVDSRLPLASTAIGARPSAVLVTTTGRVVALGADDAQMHVLGMLQIDQPLAAERVIAVPEEPVSAALVPNDDAIVVVSRWGHALCLLRLNDAAPVVIDLPRDPAAVVASSDGRRAFVMHAVGSRASIVDLVARSARTVSLDRKIHREMSPSPWKKSMPMPDDLPQQFFGADLDGFAQAPPVQSKPKRRAPPAADTVTLHADQAFALARTPDDGIIAPVVVVDTGADAQSSGYGGSSAATPAIVSFDEDGAAPPTTSSEFGSHCLLPRGIAFDAPTGTTLVACLGSDEITVSRPDKQRRPSVVVPKGPIAMAVDERGRRAVVWSAFERVVSVLAIDGQPKVTARVVPPRTTPPPSDAALRGRLLFNAAFDSRVSSDGRGCASCHPDARDDGLTWSSPGGRRQTPMLVDRLEDTAPYGWNGAAPDLARHVASTTARLGGSGLAKRDVEDIQAYIATLRAPPPPPGDAALVALGDTLFHRDDTGCAACHAGRALTDGDVHDVHSSTHEDLGRAFDTPSLHLVAASPPYFHDGRYETLSDVLSGSDGNMGHTSQLSPDDRAALEAYLRRL
jgi:hypothetical protein